MASSSNAYITILLHIVRNANVELNYCISWTMNQCLGLYCPLHESEMDRIDLYFLVCLLSALSFVDVSIWLLCSRTPLRRRQSLFRRPICAEQIILLFPLQMEPVGHIMASSESQIMRSTIIPKRIALCAFASTHFLLLHSPFAHIYWECGGVGTASGTANRKEIPRKHTSSNENR